jgi:hypothetical protein
MLESPALWVSEAERPAAAASRNSPWMRQVRLSPTGCELGRIAAHCLRWWPWRVGVLISAWEGPDQSAVFTGRRAGWLPRDWDVLDADGRLVGLVRGAYLLGADGAIFGRLQPNPNPGSGAIIDPGGSAAARWSPEGPGTRIEFASNLEEQPFLKMTILIAVLIVL